MQSELSIDENGFCEQTEALRPRLVAFAKLHLKEEADAEDAVQETLTAAWLKLKDFRGDSKFETWVFGILRRKLIDAYRKHSRIKTFSYDENALPDTENFFDHKEHWAEDAKPTIWKDPNHHIEHDQFWQVFDICVYNLPEQAARVYTLRELIGVDTNEICDSLQISEQNCWTILHRARLKLRSCLERGWFSKELSEA